MACTSCKESNIEIDKVGVKSLKSHNLFLRLLFFAISVVLLPLVFLITIFYLFKLFVFTDNASSIIQDVVNLSRWWQKRKEEKLEREMIANGELETYEEADIDEYELDEVQEEEIVK